MATITPLFIFSIVPLVKALPLDRRASPSDAISTTNPYDYGKTWGMSTWVWVSIIISIVLVGVALLYMVAQGCLAMSVCCSCQQSESPSIYQNAVYAGDRIIAPVHNQPTTHNVALPGLAGIGTYGVQQQGNYKPDAYPLSDMPSLATKPSATSSEWDQSEPYPPSFSRQYNPSRHFHG